MKKFKNIIFIIVFILIATAIALFNYKMDPYNLKSYKYNNKHAQIYKVQRDLILPILNETKQNKYEYVVVSGSSLHYPLNGKIFYRDTGRSIVSLTPEGISPQEQVDMLEYFLKIHPETKNIIVSLELNSYLNCFEDNSRKKDIKVTPFETFFKLYYSRDAINISLDKVKQKYSVKSGEKSERVKKSEKDYVAVNHKVKYFYNNTCEYANVKYIEKIKKVIKDNNANAIFILPPLHSVYLANHYYQGTYEKIENLKKMYAQITPFYDMGYSNHYTSKPWHKDFLFYDPLHGTVFFNPEITNYIVNNKVNEKFGMLVDKNNIDDVLKYQKEQLHQYMNNNQQEIEEYVNFDFNPRLAQRYVENFYFKDILQDPYEDYSRYIENLIFKNAL